MKERAGKFGCKVYKFRSPGNNGVPDRLILCPNGITRYVELKAPGKTPTVLQEYVHREFSQLGHQVAVLDSFEAIEKWIVEQVNAGVLYV